MKRYSKALLTSVVGLAFAISAMPAAAGCPGCEEYTLDIPDKKPAPAPTPAPAPAPAPTPAAPIEPAPLEVPTAPVVVEPKPEPEDPTPNPVPGKGVNPPELTSVPAVAAVQAGQARAGSSNGLLPLALGLIAVAIVGGAIGIGTRRRDQARTETGGQ